MKKICTILFILLFLTGCKKEEITEIAYDDVFIPLHHSGDKTFEYGQNYKLNEVFEDTSKITFVNEYLDVSNMGENTADIEYTVDGKQFKQKFTYNVVDTTIPLIYISNVYTMYINEEDNLVNRVICADNQDKTPNCYIDGNYDLSKAGSYPLTYVAVDNQGNKDEAKFTLVVKNGQRPTSKSSSTSKINTPLSKIMDKYKKDSTMIGIDVSKYQGDIDWKQVKDAGIEFAMIRLGFGYGDVNKMDEKYLQNIKGALENDIKVGIYFYSYATTLEEIELQSNFVLENMKDYDISFPIAFDWENYSDWNEYGISLYDLRYLSETFLNNMKKAGYSALQYGSKNYLTYFWEPIKDDIWLAFYIRDDQKQDYKNPIKMWQICNNGRVPGINGDVDIDIYYK